MNLVQLETFAWIARLGSFSAAARRLDATQPAISMRIRDLERGLGVKLFDRVGRTVRVTPKGRELLDYAERIVGLSTEARSRMGGAETFSGRMRMGVSETVALTWLPRLVAVLNEDFPALVLDLDIDLTHGLWRKLRAGVLDVVILPGPAFGADLATVYLGSSLYTWMSSPSRDIPGTVLGPKDLEAQPIITLATDSNLHDVIEQWFHSNNAEPHRIDVCNSLGVVGALTIAGLGVSMLPPEIFRDEIESGSLVVLPIEPRMEPLDFWCVHPRAHGSELHRAVAERAVRASTFEPGDDTAARPRKT